MFSELKHFPRLQNFKKPAAVEIHKEVLNPGFQKLFRGVEILKDKQPVVTLQNQAFIPSAPNMIIHNVFNAQLNDKAFVYGDLLLRQMYDLCLLSLQEDILDIAKNHGKKFKIFNTYFAAIGFVFSNPKGIEYEETSQTKFFIKKMDLFLSNSIIYQINKTIIYLSSRLIRYISIPILSIFNKDTRKLLFNRLTDRNWYGNHLRSYGKFFKP